MHGHVLFKTDTYEGLSNFSKLWWRSIRVCKIFCTSSRTSGSAASDMSSNGSRNEMGNVPLKCLVWYFVPTWKNLMCYCFLNIPKQYDVLLCLYIYSLSVNRLPKLITLFCQASHSDIWLTFWSSFITCNSRYLPQDSTTNQNSLLSQLSLPYLGDRSLTPALFPFYERILQFLQVYNMALQ